jgi:GMP synthase-like glutamine amidotransferase
MTTVYITRGAFLGDVEDMFRARGFTITHNQDEADVLCLTGGADIDPHLYAEAPLSGTWFNRNRDDQEVACYKRAVELGQFIFAICRGAQLSCALNGGRLWQHIEGHEYIHPIREIATGRVLQTTSIHHQMMRPTPDAEIIAVCNEATLKIAQFDQWHAGQDAPEDEVEVCYFPKSRALCIQGHPEVADKEFVDWCFELMENRIAACQVNNEMEKPHCVG